MLSEDKQLQVSWIVCSELAQRGYKSELDTKLSNIGWKLEGNRLTTDRFDIREMFFSKGTQHDAYVRIKVIFQQSTNSLTIIDPYIDGSIFQILKSLLSKEIRVRLLTFKSPADFNIEAKKFLAQYSNFSIELRKTKEFHDRFIIVDDNKYYHIGASIKDAGNKAFVINQIEDSHNVDALIKQQKQSWRSATKVDVERA